MQASKQASKQTSIQIWVRNRTWVFLSSSKVWWPLHYTYHCVAMFQLSQSFDFPFKEPGFWTSPKLIWGLPFKWDIKLQCTYFNFSNGSKNQKLFNCPHKHFIFCKQKINLADKDMILSSLFVFLSSLFMLCVLLMSTAILLCRRVCPIYLLL